MNRKKTSMGRKVFLAVDVIVILLLCLICMVPLLNLLAYSFSASQPIIENKVFLWPKEFTLKAYQYVLESKEFWSSVSVSVKRVLLGVPLNTLLTILVAYPLSKDERQFKARKYYVAYMLTVMLFNGGLMPTYYIVSKTKLIDTVWALIIPGAVPIFNCIVLMNFFRGIPSELEESAKLDGASQWQILWRIFIPISKPSLATIILFSLISHWNSWFDGMFYMNNPNNYPMATYLATQIINNNQTMTNMTPEQLALLSSLSEKTVRSAQLFISIIPILVVYPFLQKFFVKGITVGSVKE